MTLHELSAIESQVRRRSEVKAVLAWLVFMFLATYVIGLILG